MTNLLKADLHLHTADDPDDRLSTTRRLWSIAHTSSGSEPSPLPCTIASSRIPLSSRTRQERGITLIPGIEKTIARRHILLLNFPAQAEQVRTLSDIAAFKRRCNGIVIAPHPFFPQSTCLREQMDANPDLFDAVEWSYFWTRALDFNARAVRWANEHGKPVVGNSDLHDLRQLGRTCSLVSAEPHPDAICDAVRAGQVSLQTAPAPILELTKWSPAC